MNFNKAFDLMKQGTKVKLPSWGGFWCWDADNPSKKIQHHFIAYNKGAKSPYMVTSKYCIDKSPPIFNVWSFECASASVVTLTAQDISEGKGVGIDPNLIQFKEK